MDWLDTLTLFFGSLVANTLASLSGGGAGLLQFPLLIFLGLPFSVALGTHKVA
ncbi:sulfite exporter TauE/SafE family protein, partial [Vibrio rotiferianus]